MEGVEEQDRKPCTRGSVHFRKVPGTDRHQHPCHCGACSSLTAWDGEACWKQISGLRTKPLAVNVTRQRDSSCF